MKEAFRIWNPTKDIRTTFVDGSGLRQIWATGNQGLLSHVSGIVDHFSQQGIKLTNRQLFYQLVARDLIPNAEAVYKRICKFLTDVRYAGLIDWDAIEDRGRVPHMHAEWDNIRELVESAVHSYRLPRWRDQDYYIELFCEKQALESVFRPIADKYHIYFGYNKGYSSAVTVYDLSKRIISKIQSGKHVVVLYFGDHDASGLDMVRDVRARIDEFLTKGSESYPTDVVEIVHVGLTMEQVRQYSPPPNPAKKSDPRSKKYMERYGENSWELDSLPPDVLIRLAENAIRAHLDVGKYEAVIAREKREIKKLQEFADSLVSDGGESDE